MTDNLPSSIRLRVVSPRKLLVDEEVQEVSLPSLEGYVGILPGHRSLVLALGEGKITYRMAGREEGVNVQNKLPLLSTFMGHVNIYSTQVYLTITDSLLREANNRFYNQFGIEFKQRISL